ELVDRGGREGEAVTQKDGDLVPKDPTHDEDRRCYARAAKRDRLLEEGDAERRRAEPNQVARDVDETMAIRVGLEDRHDRGRRDGAPDRAVVLGQAFQADFDDGRANALGVRVTRRVRHWGPCRSPVSVSGCPTASSAAARERLPEPPPGWRAARRRPT